MLMGTLIGGKRYSVLEYACAMLIAAGISLFAAQKSSAKMLAAPNAQLGYALCLANLMLDGYTNAAQVGPYFHVKPWPDMPTTGARVLMTPESNMLY